MNENLDKVETPKIQAERQESPVDDKGGFVFSSAIKISDPNTKEILVQMRGDY
jgi:hypothetical protein